MASRHLRKLLREEEKEKREAAAILAAATPLRVGGVYTHPAFGDYKVVEEFLGEGIKERFICFGIVGNRCPGFIFNYDRVRDKWKPTINAYVREEGFYMTLSEAVRTAALWDGRPAPHAQRHYYLKAVGHI